MLPTLAFGGMRTLLPSGMKTSMKTTKAVFGILTITAALAVQAHAQVYHFSIPISGSKPLTIRDANGPSGSQGTVVLAFSNLTETIYLDAGAQTIRQVGTVSYIPSIP